MARQDPPKSALDALIRNRGFALNELAALVDLDVATISRHRNRRQKISREAAYRYAKVFGVDEDLLTNSEVRG